MRKFRNIALLFFLIIGFLLYSSSDKLSRLLIVNSFFEADKIVRNFQDIDEIFPCTTIPPSARPLAIAKDLSFTFPESFEHQNEKIKTTDFFDKTRTEGLLVIHKDTIIFEDYRLGLENNEKHISWSMSKSFIGTLVGVCVERGLINISDKITTYLPEFENTGYENVTVEDLLQMRSGVRFDENYADFNSDINRFGRAFALGSSYKEFAKSLKNEVPPGSRCAYVSIDTQMLGFLISKVTGKTLTEVLQSYMWEPMGMEDGGGWIIDNTGFEMALGGMTASLRDFAKLGLLYLHRGKLNDNRIVSEEWIAKATAPYNTNSENSATKASYGYGYQWWIPPHATGDYFAVGIYDQFVYVHPEKELVIAKLSADHNFKNDGAKIKAKHISLFQEVARMF